MDAEGLASVDQISRILSRKFGRWLEREDLIQEARLVALMHPHGDPDRLYGQINVRFGCLARSEQRLKRKVKVMPEHHESMPPITRLIVDEAMHGLTRRQRAVIRGVFWLQETRQETAARLGGTEGAIRRTRTQAYQRLRERLA